MSIRANPPGAYEKARAGLADQVKKVEEADQAIREAAIPKKLRIEVSAAP